MNFTRTLPQFARTAALAVAFAAASLAATPVQAQTAKAPAAASAPTTPGEVRKIDRAQAMVTIKHGPIANLDMPAMTMAFKASDPKLLERIKVGDKVRFSAVDANGTLTVTAIEPAK
jgi:Cu/Ag efflux protein CusF